jgi:hypothetical protein
MMKTYPISITEEKPRMAKNPTLAVYLGEELMDRVTAAKDAGQFDPKEVVKGALEAALAGSGPVDDLLRQAWMSVIAGMQVPEDLSLLDAANWIVEAGTAAWEKSQAYDAQFAAMNERLGGDITSWDQLFTRLQQLLDAERDMQMRQSLQGDGAVEFTANGQVEGQASATNFVPGMSGILTSALPEFVITFSDDLEQLTAHLDALASQGGWPVSASMTPDGRYMLMSAWPEN